MNDRDYKALKKITAEALMISEMVSGFDCETFLQDEKTKRAVCMTIINIGELVKVLSDEFRSKYVSIPWRKIAGMRDIAAHGYQTLQMKDIWETAVTYIPQLLENINSILKSEK